MLPTQIEINPTELCNRNCSFCPRGDGYPNVNNYLSIKNANIINQKLIEFGYIGSLHLTGQGEPTLNPNFEHIVEIFYDNPNLNLKMTTNGDYIGKKNFSYFKYFTEIRISVYDGEDRYTYIKDLTKQYNVIIRKQYATDKYYNNCGGWFNSNCSNNNCYLPFYELYIDWNLDVRLCCHDWKEKKIISNLNNDTLHNIWYKKFKSIRKELIINKRKNLTPCNKCNVNGTMNVYTKIVEGDQHYNYFKMNILDKSKRYK